jgi:hypothetical protein
MYTKWEYVPEILTMDHECIIESWTSWATSCNSEDSTESAVCGMLHKSLFHIGSTQNIISSWNKTMTTIVPHDYECYLWDDLYGFDVGTYINVSTPKWNIAYELDVDMAFMSLLPNGSAQTDRFTPKIWRCIFNFNFKLYELECSNW